MRPDEAVGADGGPPLHFDRGVYVTQCVSELGVVIERVAGRQRLRAGAENHDLYPLPRPPHNLGPPGPNGPLRPRRRVGCNGHGGRRAPGRRRRWRSRARRLWIIAPHEPTLGSGGRRRPGGSLGARRHRGLGRGLAPAPSPKGEAGDERGGGQRDRDAGREPAVIVRSVRRRRPGRNGVRWPRLLLHGQRGPPWVKRVRVPELLRRWAARGLLRPRRSRPNKQHKTDCQRYCPSSYMQGSRVQGSEPRQGASRVRKCTFPQGVIRRNLALIASSRS